MDFDTTVKMSIYQIIAETAKMPSAHDIAQSLGASVKEVREAFQSLHQRRLLVPELDDPMKIRMAPPFSGIETPFAVLVGEKTYYGNCAWDALGISAALHTDAVVETMDAQSGEPMKIEVRNQRPISQQCAIHFAVPVAQWWDDIIHT